MSGTPPLGPIAEVVAKNVKSDSDQNGGQKAAVRSLKGLFSLKGDIGVARVGGAPLLSNDYSWNLVNADATASAIFFASWAAAFSGTSDRRAERARNYIRPLFAYCGSLSFDAVVYRDRN
jgi:hypothetical protein